MKNSNFLLNADLINITEKISIRIPAVKEILENEQLYFHIVTAFTATPYQYMVQLDDMGVDYTQVSDYDLFTMLFPQYAKWDLSILFGSLFLSDYKVCHDPVNSTKILYSPTNGPDYKIDELVYMRLSQALRIINNLERVSAKPGNEEAKRYLMEKERKKMRRNAGRQTEPYFEKLVIALVNRPEFKYNYEEVMQLSIYNFQQSVKQIETNIAFDKTILGIYSGSIDTSKIKDKSCLSWIPAR